MLPKSKGGKDKAENIIISCRRCNTMKRDMLMNEFLEYAMIRLYKCVGEYMALIEKRHNRIRRDGKNDTYAQKLLEKRYPVQNDITYFTRIISNLPEYL